MKNVLGIVSYPFLPAKMGGQKCIAFFYRFFSLHINLTCVATKNNAVELAEGYDVLNILSNNKLRYINLFYFFTIKRLIKKNNITHILLEHPYYGWLGILLKRFCGVTLIIHSHNIESLRFKSIGKWWWPILSSYEKIVYKKADTCFFITDEDKGYAINTFGVEAQKCTTIPYGFELTKIPSVQEKQTARAFLNAKFTIAANEKIILFNGTLNYKPNLDALDVILKKINPILLDTGELQYKIIICGKNLPEVYNNLAAYHSKNILFAGFVDDINPYFIGADIFINPVIDGGGIKTKLVEALGYNLNVITTANGAIGVPLNYTGNKMSIVKENDWDLFAEEIINCSAGSNIPDIFFTHFFWGDIAARAAAAI
jgi:hypothetical protein